MPNIKEKIKSFFNKSFLTVAFSCAAGLAPYPRDVVLSQPGLPAQPVEITVDPPANDDCACAEPTANGDPTVTTPNRYAYIVIDEKTGAVIKEKDADLPLYPASMTKMMTLYLTFEAIESGQLSLSQYLPVSRHAAAQPASALFLSSKDSITVEKAIHALTVKSANDCAVVLAEAIGGTEKNFAKMMSTKACDLGMSGTHFANASGLPDQNNFSTVRDMATLSNAIINDWPQYYPAFSKKTFTYNGKTHYTHNRLLNTYPGMDGLKTGFINASGFNLAASATQNGERVIAVIIGGQSAASRNKNMEQLLNDGFTAIRKTKTAAPKKEQADVKKTYTPT